MIIIKENIFIKIRINLTKYINKIIIYIFLSLDLLKYFIIDKYAYFIETYLIFCYLSKNIKTVKKLF